jgi:hypothetical protein
MRQRGRFKPFNSLVSIEGFPHSCYSLFRRHKDWYITHSRWVAGSFGYSQKVELYQNETILVELRVFSTTYSTLA